MIDLELVNNKAKEVNLADMVVLEDMVPVLMDNKINKGQEVSLVDQEWKDQEWEEEEWKDLEWEEEEWKDLEWEEEANMVPLPGNKEPIDSVSNSHNKDLMELEVLQATVDI